MIKMCDCIPCTSNAPLSFSHPPSLSCPSPCLCCSPFSWTLIAYRPPSVCLPLSLFLSYSPVSLQVSHCLSLFRSSLFLSSLLVSHYIYLSLCLPPSVYMPACVSVCLALSQVSHTPFMAHLQVIITGHVTFQLSPMLTARKL